MGKSNLEKKVFWEIQNNRKSFMAGDEISFFLGGEYQEWNQGVAFSLEFCSFHHILLERLISSTLPRANYVCVFFTALYFQN